LHVLDIIFPILLQWHEDYSNPSFKLQGLACMLELNWRLTLVNHTQVVNLTCRYTRLIVLDCIHCIF